MMIGTDDNELLQAYARDGSEAAFGELVRRHQTMMRATAYRVCGDSEEAMDAMQRVLIAFARRAKEIRAEGGVGPWLHRAATLEAMSLRRQRIKRQIREHEALEIQPQPSRGMPSEVATELDSVINKLLPKDRDVIVLHYFQGLTFRAIAGKLGGSEAAWQKRGVRALSKISVALKRRGVVTSSTAIGTWMIATPAEAGLPATTLNPMVGKALQPALSTATPLKGAPILYLIMKTKIALTACFIGSAVLSYTWSEQVTNSTKKDQINLISVTTHTRFERTQREPPGFNIDGIGTAVRHYDSLEKDDPSSESQLRALMFSVPESYLSEVRDILGEVKNINRFHDVAAAFYARWAEIDPESAYLAAADAGAFSDFARRGVLLTWLNVEPDLALARLLDDRKPEDLGTLSEFIDKKAQHSPWDAAMLVDSLAGKWPEADKRLFPKVAKTWALIDPAAAGEWIASHWDPKVRNQILKQLAWRIASTAGRKGLALADRIDDTELRFQSRNGAARWWGIASGGRSVSGKTNNPDLDMSGGFPSDWGHEEIRSFSLGTMANYAKNYPELIATAKDETQRQAVYEGVINGASFSQPALVVDAVESVDPTFATTSEGNKSLKSFILRWTENDPNAATTWLASQPQNSKTQLMQETMANKSN